MARIDRTGVLLMDDRPRTGAELRSARAAGVSYTRDSGELDSADDALLHYASSAYDQIESLAQVTARPMSPVLVYALLGNLHAMVGVLPRLLGQLSDGQRRLVADSHRDMVARVEQVTVCLAEAQAVAEELARRLAIARAAADDHHRADRSARPAAAGNGDDHATADQR